jgi:hypothetical protein
MTYKRTPTDDEIEALAEIFRPLWRVGEAVRPWLRKHDSMLNDLVHDDWSWAGVAAALDRAGIAYGTGKPWQAEQLRAKIAGTRRPLKHTKAVLAKISEAAPDGSAEDDRVLEILPRAKPLDLRIAVAEGRTDPHPPSDATEKTSPPGHVPEPRFKPAVAKPYTPPVQPTSEERAEIDANRKRILGY